MYVRLEASGSKKTFAGGLASPSPSAGLLGRSHLARHEEASAFQATGGCTQTWLSRKKKESVGEREAGWLPEAPMGTLFSALCGREQRGLFQGLKPRDGRFSPWDFSGFKSSLGESMIGNGVLHLWKRPQYGQGLWLKALGSEGCCFFFFLWKLTKGLLNSIQ